MKRIIFIALALGFLVSCNQARRFVEHTVDVDTAFGNYEWFHDTYQEIEATVQKIKIAYEMYTDKNVTGEARLNYQTNYTGAVNYIQTLVASYNSNSSKWNRTLFKDKKLPYKIKVSVAGGDVIISEGNIEGGQ